MKRTKMITKTITTGVLGLSILAQSAVISNASFAVSLPTDIGGHWSEAFVTSLVNQGVISGYPDGTFKPDKEVSYAEFLVLTLKALDIQPETATNGQAWYEPIINKSIEIGIIKTSDNMANLEYANLPIPRQESAYVLYNALKIKEGLVYNHGYDETLNQAIYDHSQIDSKYIDAVYSMLQQGMFTGSNNNFLPADKTTRGATGVIIERVIDPTKRADKNELTKNVTFKSTRILPKVSTKSVTMNFQNGEPVLNQSQIISELKALNDNIGTLGLGDVIHYQDYINTKWPGWGGETLESRTKIIDEEYQTILNYMNTRYNFNYQDNLDVYGQNLYKYMYESSYTRKLIDGLKSNIQKDTLIMKSYFITDKTLLYINNNGREMLRGRLYFKFDDKSKSACLYYDEDGGFLPASKNQWYYVDVEVQVVTQSLETGLKPCVDERRMIDYLCDYVLVK